MNLSVIFGIVLLVLIVLAFAGVLPWTVPAIVAVVAFCALLLLSAPFITRRR